MRWRMGLALTALALTVATTPLAQAQRVSAPGVYAGYSAPTYDNVQRTSVYVPAADGTRLAIDVYRPMRAGRVETRPLPVIFSFTPYNRATRLPDGTVQPPANLALGLAAYGYVVAIADVRGKGASFGVRSGPADDNELSDAATLVQWLGTQPWSSGRIGLNGCSYLGSTVMEAARAPSRFVRAVFVGASQFDQYGAFAPGGIASRGLADEVTPADRVPPVDADTDGALRAQAIAEHARNTETGQFFAASPYRDDVNPFTRTPWWIRASVYPHVGEYRRDIGFYFHSGYYDPYGTQTLLQYLNMPNPSRFTYGGWSHCESPGFRLDVERLRFFDYWLKDIQNGVMAEPPVLVEMGRAQAGTEWRALYRWPTDATRTRYYLSAEPSQVNRAIRSGIRPLIDGSLTSEAPAAGARSVTVTGLPEVAPYILYGYPVAGVEAYSASFTLAQQTTGREIVGRPTARLWISTAERDADLYVYLQAVHRMGGAEVIASGQLRASHRRTGQPPYDTGGVPWQTHLRADAQPLTPNQPVELEVGLTAAAYALQPGDQLRLSVTTRNPRDGGSPPAVTILSDAAHPSSVEIPDVDTRSRALNPDGSWGRVGALPRLFGTPTAGSPRR